MLLTEWLLFNAHFGILKFIQQSGFGWGTWNYSNFVCLPHVLQTVCQWKAMSLLKNLLSWSQVSSKVKAIVLALHCLVQRNDLLSSQTDVHHLLILGLCRLKVLFAQQTWHFSHRHLFPLQQQDPAGLRYRISQINQCSHGQQLLHLVKSSGHLQNRKHPLMQILLVHWKP